MFITRRQILLTATAAAACRTEGEVMSQRKVDRVITLPQPHQGQFGPDHRVVEVITQDDWLDADPFILLMDDRINGHFQGGAHPHTGMETVSFLVDGRIGQESSEGHLSPGDVEWTTTGKGIVHGGHVSKGALDFRLLQLWVTLPKKERWAEPDHQFVPKTEALLREEPGARVRLYSGTSGTLRSKTRNHVPVTVASIELQPGASIDQDAPATHNGFFYVLEGTARAGGERLVVGQAGWLDKSDGSTVHVENAGEVPLHVLFYSGERQNIPLVTYGPFVGDTPEDINRAFRDYRAGTFITY
jgi:redox-sensitive bicupin YhaK (pirin superfamily)